MKSDEIRKKYIQFFEKRGHKKISPAPLVLEDDPTTLFVSAGMQPLIPYLKGKKHPRGTRLVNSQPSIRLQDIEEVGDKRHMTFFEMLGNWSLGDYFKKEQLAWCFEFFTKELGLSKDKLWVSVFKGDENVPKDNESFAIWKSLGITEERIYFYGVNKNWWSNSGSPAEMATGDIGGPDSEVFYDFGEPHNPMYGDECHPNCDCGRFLEIGNSVFIEYEKQSDGSLKELTQKNVDFGGGLERITAAVNQEIDNFQIDIFKPLIDKIIKATGKSYEGNEKSMQIIADHIRAADAISIDGVVPSNKLQGYVMRRLIRRAVVQMKSLKKSIEENDFIKITNNPSILGEIGKFKKTLEKGLKEVEKIDKIDGKTAFDLFSTYGFPIEITTELFSQKGQKIDKNEFENEFEKHKAASRTASAGMFKGGLADHSDEVVKLHTATHLLLASLRKVLGEHVVQKGQNITKERSRFDFFHPQKLSEDELKSVEDLINEKIKSNLPVSYKTLPKDEALKTGAIHAFNEKYADTVNVYFIGKNWGTAISREFCGGPHVASTGEIGHVRIIKQEKIGSDLVRIYTAIK